MRQEEVDVSPLLFPSVFDQHVLFTPYSFGRGSRREDVVPPLIGELEDQFGIDGDPHWQQAASAVRAGLEAVRRLKKFADSLRQLITTSMRTYTSSEMTVRIRQDRLQKLDQQWDSVATDWKRTLSPKTINRVRDQLREAFFSYSGGSRSEDEPRMDREVFFPVADTISDELLLLTLEKHRTLALPTAVMKDDGGHALVIVLQDISDDEKADVTCEATLVNTGLGIDHHAGQGPLLTFARPWRLPELQGLFRMLIGYERSNHPRGSHYTFISSFYADLFSVAGVTEAALPDGLRQRTAQRPQQITTDCVYRSALYGVAQLLEGAQPTALQTSRFNRFKYQVEQHSGQRVVALIAQQLQDPTAAPSQLPSTRASLLQLLACRTDDAGLRGQPNGSETLMVVPPSDLEPLWRQVVLERTVPPFERAMVMAPVPALILDLSVDRQWPWQASSPAETAGTWIKPDLLDLLQHALAPAPAVGPARASSAAEDQKEEDSSWDETPMSRRTVGQLLNYLNQLTSGKVDHDYVIKLHMIKSFAQFCCYLALDEQVPPLRGLTQTAELDTLANQLLQLLESVGQYYIDQGREGSDVVIVERQMMGLSLRLLPVILLRAVDFFMRDLLASESAPWLTRVVRNFLVRPAPPVYLLQVAKVWTTRATTDAPLPAADDTSWWSTFVPKEWTLAASVLDLSDQAFLRLQETLGRARPLYPMPTLHNATLRLPEDGFSLNQLVPTQLWADLVTEARLEELKWQPGDEYIRKMEYGRRDETDQWSTWGWDENNPRPTLTHAERIGPWFLLQPLRQNCPWELCLFRLLSSVFSPAGSLNNRASPPHMYEASVQATKFPDTADELRVKVEMNRLVFDYGAIRKGTEHIRADEAVARLFVMLEGIGRTDQATQTSQSLQSYYDNYGKVDYDQTCDALLQVLWTPPRMIARMLEPSTEVLNHDQVSLAHKQPAMGWFTNLFGQVLTVLQQANAAMLHSIRWDTLMMLTVVYLSARDAPTTSSTATTIPIDAAIPALEARLDLLLFDRGLSHIRQGEDDPLNLHHGMQRLVWMYLLFWLHARRPARVEEIVAQIASPVWRKEHAWDARDVSPSGVTREWNAYGTPQGKLVRALRDVWVLHTSKSFALAVASALRSTSTFTLGPVLVRQTDDPEDVLFRTSIHGRQYRVLGSTATHAQAKQAAVHVATFLQLAPSIVWTLHTTDELPTQRRTLTVAHRVCTGGADDSRPLLVLHVPGVDSLADGAYLVEDTQGQRWRWRSWQDLPVHLARPIQRLARHFGVQVLVASAAGADGMVWQVLLAHVGETIQSDHRGAHWTWRGHTVEDQLVPELIGRWTWSLPTTLLVRSTVTVTASTVWRLALFPDWTLGYGMSASPSPGHINEERLYLEQKLIPDPGISTSWFKSDDSTPYHELEIHPLGLSLAGSSAALWEYRTMAITHGHHEVLSLLIPKLLALGFTTIVEGRRHPEDASAHDKDVCGADASEQAQTVAQRRQWPAHDIVKTTGARAVWLGTPFDWALSALFDPQLVHQNFARERHSFVPSKYRWPQAFDADSDDATVFWRTTAQEVDMGRLLQTWDDAHTVVTRHLVVDFDSVPASCVAVAGPDGRAPLIRHLREHVLTRASASHMRGLLELSDAVVTRWHSVPMDGRASDIAAVALAAPVGYRTLIQTQSYHVAQHIAHWLETSDTTDCAVLVEVLKSTSPSVLHLGPRNHFEVIFELYFGRILRREQMDMVQRIMDDATLPSSSKAWFQMLMGKGKTSAIMPYVAFHWLVVGSSGSRGGSRGGSPSRVAEEHKEDDEDEGDVRMQSRDIPQHTAPEQEPRFVYALMPPEVIPTVVQDVLSSFTPFLRSVQLATQSSQTRLTNRIAGPRVLYVNSASSLQFELIHKVTSRQDPLQPHDTPLLPAGTLLLYDEVDKLSDPRMSQANVNRPDRAPLFEAERGTLDWIRAETIRLYARAVVPIVAAGTDQGRRDLVPSTAPQAMVLAQQIIADAIEYDHKPEWQVAWAALTDDGRAQQRLQRLHAPDPYGVQRVFVLQQLMSTLAQALLLRYRKDYGLGDACDQVTKRVTQLSNQRLAIPYDAVDQPQNGSRFQEVLLAVVTTGLNYVYRGLMMMEIRELLVDVHLPLLLATGNQVSQRHLREVLLAGTGDLVARLQSEGKGIMLTPEDVAALSRRPQLVSQWFLHLLQLHLKVYLSCWNTSFLDIMSASFATHRSGFTGTIATGEDSYWPTFVLPNGQQSIREFKRFEADRRAEREIRLAVTQVRELVETKVSISSSAADIIQEVLDILVSTNCQVLIDAGAWLRGTDTYDAVKRLQSAVSRQQQRQVSVVYWDSSDRRRVYDGSAQLKSLTSISSQDALFYYYDHKHTRGVDAPQPAKLRGLCTISLDNALSDLAQAIYRMRKLNYGHSVQFLVEQALWSVLTDAAAEVSASGGGGDEDLDAPVQRRVRTRPGTGAPPARPTTRTLLEWLEQREQEVAYSKRIPYMLQNLHTNRRILAHHAEDAYVLPVFDGLRAAFGLSAAADPPARAEVGVGVGVEVPEPRLLRKHTRERQRKALLAPQGVNELEAEAAVEAPRPLVTTQDVKRMNHAALLLRFVQATIPVPDRRQSIVYNQWAGLLAELRQAWLSGDQRALRTNTPDRVVVSERERQAEHQVQAEHVREHVREPEDAVQSVFQSQKVLHLQDYLTPPQWPIKFHLTMTAATEDEQKTADENEQQQQRKAQQQRKVQQWWRALHDLQVASADHPALGVFMSPLWLSNRMLATMVVEDWVMPGRALLAVTATDDGRLSGLGAEAALLLTDGESYRLIDQLPPLFTGGAVRTITGGILSWHHVPDAAALPDARGAWIMLLLQQHLSLQTLLVLGGVLAQAGVPRESVLRLAAALPLINADGSRYRRLLMTYTPTADLWYRYLEAQSLDQFAHLASMETEATDQLQQLRHDVLGTVRLQLRAIP